MNLRAQEAIDRIREATGGRLEIRLFPANQLGSDTDLLSQVRSGGVELFNLSSSILATLVPAAGIVNTGFAFPDYDTVWKAMDGELGTYVRAQIAKAGLLTASPRLGQRLSPGHHLDAPDQRARGSERPEDPGPAGADTDLALQGARRRCDAHQLQRALLGTPDQGGGGPGEPAADHRDDQALRGPEVLQHDRPCLGRLLDPGEPACLEPPARRRPRDRRSRSSTRSATDERADIAQAERLAARGPDREGAQIQRRGPGALPRGAAQDHLLPGLEREVRRRGLGLPRASSPASWCSRRDPPRERARGGKR